MTTGKYPFDGDTVFLLFENIAKGEFVIPDNVDEVIKQLNKYQHLMQAFDFDYCLLTIFSP